MDNQIVIKATKRTVTGRKVQRYRREGKLPGVMYGSNFESTPIFMDLHETTLLLRGVSSSTLLMIELDGKQYATLIQDRQKNFIQGSFSHIDFRVVDMNVVIAANVRLNFVGDAPIIESMGGTLLTETQEVEVEALPANLPETLDVDLSLLVSYDTVITVADLVIPENVTVLADMETVLASAAPLAMEKEEEETGLEDGIEPEVIGESEETEE